MELIDNLSSAFPNYNFIIRPHPSENDAPYINTFKLKKNIKVIHSGNVVKWIHASKAVIHYDCTTGIESLIADKLAISYTPKIDKNILAWLPVMASKNVKLKSEVIKIIKNLDKEKKHFLSAPETKILNNYIYNLSNESSEKIVRLFEMIEFAKENPNDSGDYNLRLATQRIKSRISVILFKLRLYNKNSISLTKFNSVQKEEIYSTFKKFSIIHQIENKISVQIYGGNVAHIKKIN